MKNSLCIFIIFQIFYIARAESSFGLKFGNSFNKSRFLTFTDSPWYEEVKLDNFFTIPYVEFFLNLNGNKGSIGFGQGNQGTTAKDFDGNDYNYGEFDRWKFYLSYQNTKILNNLLLPSNLKNIINLSPIITFFDQEKFYQVFDSLDDRYDYENRFISGFEIGASAHYLKFGKYKPYITFSLPLSNKTNESWSFHIGLDINIPLGAESKDFEDF